MNIPNQLGNLRPILTAGWRRIAASAAAQSLATLPWRNGLFGLFLAGILAYGVFFAGYLLVSFDLLNIVRDANHDDSFYYFQLARNLAAGQFSTFDGGITQTNGYHPLWLLLITPFYWVMDAETALFGIKGFELILIAGAILLIAAAARLTGQLWLLLFALPALLYANPILFQGLEAAAALFMLGLLFPALALYARNPARWQWPLAAVAFLLPWARLEYIPISLTATAAMGLLAAWRPEPAVDAGGGLASWRSRIAPAMFIPFLGAVAGILIYFAYNWLVFDGLTPVSGAVKYSWSRNLWNVEGGYNLFGNFREALQIPVFGYELLIALEVCIYAPLVWWLARRAESRRDWLLLAFLVGVLSLGIGHIAKFVQTGLMEHPALHWEFSWYYVPAYLLAALIIPVRCFVALYLIRQFLGPRWRRTAQLLSGGVVVIGAAALLATADFTQPFRFVDLRSNTVARSDQWAAGAYSGIQVANRILPEGSIIGSWDAGIVAYFSQFPVVNLDGLVNSYDYLRALDADLENGVHRFGQFRPVHRELGVTHILNGTWNDFENTLFAGVLETVGRQVKIWAAAPIPEAEAAARLWENLTPHFAYRDGDVGLMVDNRVALAVARDCTPEEIIVWSWDIPGSKPVFQLGKTNRGPGDLCVSEAVLPLAAPAVAARVETMPAREYLTRLRAKELPAARSQYDVYLTENNLIYTREECSGEDLESFFLFLDPAEVADLPEWRLQYGFDNRSFDFRRYGMQVDGICLVNAPLPGYAITRIRTGQLIETDGNFEHLWEEKFPTDLSYDERLARVDLQKAAVPPRDYLAMLTADREPLIRSDYDVYLVANRLIYAREQCRPEAAPANFFLHLYPSDPENLPEVFQDSGFDNRDFDFQQYGVQADGMCLANVPLPPHDIVRIRTGQFVKVGGDFSNLWEEDVWNGETPP